MRWVGKTAAMVGHKVAASRQMPFGNVQIVFCLSQSKSTIYIPPQKVRAGQFIGPGDTCGVVSYELDVGMGGTGCLTQQVAPKKDCKGSR